MTHTGQRVGMLPSQVKKQPPVTMTTDRDLEGPHAGLVRFSSGFGFHAGK